MGDALHLIPRGDLIEHESDDDCACGPRSEPLKLDDGSVKWIIVHHSLDGREKGEVEVRKADAS